MEYPLCDLCGEVSSTPLYSEDQWFRVSPKPFRLVKCNRCGLIYLNPRPSPDEIGAYYKDSYSCYKPEYSPKEIFLLKFMRKRKLAQRRKMIEKYCQKQQGAILDVGCATGLFLREMQAAKWAITGVEPSQTAVDYASKILGLKVHQGFLEQIPLPAESFDVITYWDVLEHTFSPKNELAKVVSLLKKDGVLAINVPNYDSYDRNWLDVYWLGLDPPRHLYLFSQQTLTRYLEEAGLTVIDWVCFIPAYFSTSLSIEKWIEINHPRFSFFASKFFGFPGMRFIFEPLYWLTNRQKKSGIISVFAKKKG